MQTATISGAADPATPQTATRRRAVHTQFYLGLALFMVAIARRRVHPVYLIGLVGLFVGSLRS